MRVEVGPSTLRGELEIPSSKSHTLRAILFGTLACGKTVVQRPLVSSDTDSMVKACRLLGAKIEVFPSYIAITGGLRPAEDVIDAGNSGIVLRFVGAVAALTSEYAVITGDYSIRHLRPIKPLLDGLSQLGAFATSMRGDGFAPIIVKGPLRGGTALIEGEDSQPISGLLIASAFAPEKTEIFVTNPGEKPWVALTLNWFDRLGISYTNDRFEKYTLAGSSMIDGFSYTVPSDLSSAAYPIVAALITDSELTLKQIDLHDIQGDKNLIFQLQKMGARIDIDHGQKTVTVRRGSKLQGKKIDVNNFIDGITILAVLGCFAEGVTEIVGGKGARHKESDRICTIVQELKKMGAHIHEKEDGMVIQHSDLYGADLFSHADHRLAMSLAVAGLGAEGKSSIEGVECISKSYPPFFDHLRKIGANIE